jgi:hypothetical protein
LAGVLAAGRQGLALLMSDAVEREVMRSEVLGEGEREGLGKRGLDCGWFGLAIVVVGSMRLVVVVVLVWYLAS